MPGFIKSLTSFFNRSRRTAAFVQWAKEQAVMLSNPDFMNDEIEKFSILDETLKDKRIVFLGEEDHWIHQKTNYRIIMLRYLISRGWRFIGEEIGWFDGILIDKYLQTGQISGLDQVTSYGYTGNRRNDREDSQGGILGEITKNYPYIEFKSEQTRLAKDIYNQNARLSNKIKFFGFDINTPGEGYSQAASLLNNCCKELKQLLKQVAGETVEEEIVRLNQLLEHLNINITLQQQQEKLYRQLVHCLSSIRNSLTYFLSANSAENYQQLNKAMAIREKNMYHNVQYILSEMKPHDKLVLMGHNRHLSKNINNIKRAGAAPPGGYLVPSLGTYLNKLFPDQVFSIWMLHNRGQSAQPFTQLSKSYTPHPQSLNTALAQVGPVFLLPTFSHGKRASLLHKMTNIVGIYNQVFQATVSEQADAIFFVDEVSPLQQ